MTSRIIVTVPFSSEHGAHIEVLGKSSEEPIETYKLLPGEQKSLLVGDSVHIVVTEKKL